MLLITGITGLTGRFLYEEIQQKVENTEVKYLVRSTSDTSFMTDKDRRNNLVIGDIANISKIIETLEPVSTIIHLAYIQNSAVITDACLKNGIKRVYYVTTTGIFSKYKSYTTLYAELEEKIKNSGLVYTIIRPTMIYGNHRDVNIHKLVKLMNLLPVFPIIGEGSGLMHPIYAKDLAKVVLSSYLHEKESRMKEYNVAGAYPLTYLKLLQTIAGALNKNIRFVKIPYKLALGIGKICDYIPNGLVDYEKIQRLHEDKNFDYSLAKNELDFQPISFEEGIKLEVEALRLQGII